MPASIEVDVEGRRLHLTNLDKVLYPEAGFTKADVVDYYRRIAPALLPHLAGRPPTLVRAPDGVGGERFFEKNCPRHRPPWVATAPAPGVRHGCLVDGLPALVWLANLAALELHVHQARTTDPTHPTAVVVDLDPGPPATVLDCCRVALDLRAVLERLGLVALVKTSGSKGLHLAVPLNLDGRGAGGGGRGRPGDDETKAFALALGRLLASRDPARVTVDMAKAERPGKVFVDWSQNDRHKTTVAPYSLRIRPRPTVSTPVTWEEVETALDAGDAGALTFEAPAVLARVERFGDLWAAHGTTKQELPALA